MTKIEWQSGWTGLFGGINSDYYRMVYEKAGHRPYMDASYWTWWEQWFQKEVNGEFVRTSIKAPWGDRLFHPISHIEFENESDAILFRLMCP